MLKGRAAIVTGSTSGIGKGIAKALAENGCDLMLNGFGDMEEVEHQRSTLARMYGVEVLYSDGDMSQECECEELVSEAEARLGRLDILVNNAGIQYIAAVEDFPTDRWNSILAINLTAAFHTIKRSLPIMKRSGWGRIINIASASTSPFSRKATPTACGSPGDRRRASPWWKARTASSGASQ